MVENMSKNRKIILDKHDEALTDFIRTAIDKVIAKAHMPSGVAKRIVSRAVYHRNMGRKAAIANYPFSGICEVSGLPIDDSIKSLDEIEGAKGYVSGNLRWVCQKANNNGTGTCGKC
ncbi:MAG: hypothetical protein WCV73_02315 [Patescibacteria group bacterium]|jgi:hypothetical protein